jgi:uncharacterized protein (DUF58 family)
MKAADRAGWLRRDAERISGSLPPLLVEAERMVVSLLPGVHGRRRSGPGETFWQYRPAHAGDTLSDVDWRRSARSDRLFVREMEWEAAETVMLWCDRSQSMNFASARARRSKAERAALLTLALGVLLARGDERFGLMGTDAEPPAGGQTQLVRMAALLTADNAARPDHGTLPRVTRPRVAKAVYMSDFLGPEEALLPALLDGSGRGISGILLQILDPDEEEFPYSGRTRFESVGHEVRHETDQAASLKQAYLERLAARRDLLSRSAPGWRLICHRTDESPRKALLALYAALGGS